MNKIFINWHEYLNYDNGFFIESGAYDGIFESNTKHLEDRGWNGLLIEPSIDGYNLCKQNRKSISINCALVGPDYSLSFIEGCFKNLNPCSHVNYIPDYFSQHQINSTNQNADELVAVPAKTIQSIIDEYNIKNIDFWSLDVEGIEQTVMDGMDFNKNPPKYIRIETANFLDREERIYAYLNKRGYEFLGMASGNDCFYKFRS